MAAGPSFSRNLRVLRQITVQPVYTCAVFMYITVHSIHWVVLRVHVCNYINAERFVPNAYNLYVTHPRGGSMLLAGQRTCDSLFAGSSPAWATFSGLGLVYRTYTCKNKKAKAGA